MRPLEAFPPDARRRIRFVLMDLDDTLTLEGRMPAASYGALERLQQAGLKVVPITGRPAGWCDHMARMWPVDGVGGENGAFYFHYDRALTKMVRRYWKDEAQRSADRTRLEAVKRRILEEVPGAALAADQPYRETDLAIDYREDVPPLSRDEVDRIVALFEEAGAKAKVSSIHVNGWFGDYDKLTTTRALLSELFQLDAEAEREAVLFVGDSPNDAPLFAFFPNAVGVANLKAFAGQLETEPAWVTEKASAHGFAELADWLLEER